MVAGCRFIFAFNLLTLPGQMRNNQQAMRPGGPGNQDQTVNQLSFGLAAVLAVESFDAAGGVNQLLFAGEKGMTTGTYLEPDLRLRRPRLPRFTACAVNIGGNVLWMNIRLHFAAHSCCEFSCRINIRGYLID